MASRGIFVGTQVLTLIVGASLARFSVSASLARLGEVVRAVVTSREVPVIHTGVTLLVVLDLASIGVTLYVMRQARVVAVPPAPLPMEDEE